MKTIAVKLWDHRDNASTEVAVPLLLQTVPPVTASGATPSLGRWMCMSAYIGKRYSGLYFIKQVPLPSCADDTQLWLGLCDRPYNPYAFFFDTEDTSSYEFSRPFMYLDSFDFSYRKDGKGKLLQYFVPSAGFDLNWSAID